jgi:hypothetical protein
LEPTHTLLCSQYFIPHNSAGYWKFQRLNTQTDEHYCSISIIYSFHSINFTLSDSYLLYMLFQLHWLAASGGKILSYKFEKLKKKIYRDIF